MQKGPPSVRADTPPTDCFRCGYNLHSIADTQPCPECGLLAGRSRRETDELHDTRPKWLRNISWGVNFILLAIVSSVAWLAIVNEILPYYDWRNYLPRYAVIMHEAFESIGFTIVGTLMLLGIFLLTRPEGYEPADQMERSLRKRLQMASVILLAAIELWVFNGQGSFTNGTFLFLLQYRSDWALASLILLTLAMVPFVLLLLKHLRTIANRARSAHIAEHCTLVARGSAAAFIYIAIAILLAGRGDFLFGPSWMSRSPAALPLALIVALFTSLFILWSLYLLIAFAISFRRAARQMRTKWTRDDRALEPQ